MAEKVMDNVTIQNTRILFRNFSGREGLKNRKGDRNFSTVLSPEIAEDMQKAGWNVKVLNGREEGDEPLYHLPTKLKFGNKGRPPRVVLVTSRGRTELSEEMVSQLDFAEITNVDIIVRPYNWDIDGKTGVTAYVQSIYVTIHEDPLERKYADLPDSPDSASSSLQYTPFEDELR